jgi:hypothetical protein
MNYVEMIKGLIKGHVKDLEGASLNRPYFDNELYIALQENIVLFAKLNGLPEVDTEMLQGYYQAAVNEYLSNDTIDVDRQSSLVKTGYETWLVPDRIESIKWNYSNRYFTHLGKKGRAESIIDGYPRKDGGPRTFLILFQGTCGGECTIR